MQQYAKDGTCKYHSIEGMILIAFLVCPCSSNISPMTLVTVAIKYTLPISTYKSFELNIYMPYPPIPVSTMTFEYV